MKSRRDSFAVAGLLSGLMLVLSGCTGAQFSVEAMRTHGPEREPVTYRIVPVSSRLVATHASFLQVAGYVETALGAKGYRLAGPGERADMLIELDFGEDPPRIETRTRSVDIYEDVPETTVTTTVKEVRAHNVVIPKTVTRTIPAHSKVVDTDTETYEVTIYPKWLRITARDQPGSPAATPAQRLWFVDVRNEDESDRLEFYLIWMVAAAMDHLGQTLESERVIWVGNHSRSTKVLLHGGEYEGR